MLLNILSHGVNFFFPHVFAEEEHVESRGKGVCPGEEILGVPLTPMEPPPAHMCTHTSPRIFSETLTLTHRHTIIIYINTDEIGGVRAGPVGGWGYFFFLLSLFLFLYSFYFLFACKLRDIWDQGRVRGI